MEEEIGSINIHHHHQGESNVSGNNINISSSNYEIINNNSNNDDAQYYYCYSLMEAMPLPGPTWSTTPPSLLEEPPPASSTIEECCWLGFLEGLEDNGKMVISSDDGDHYLDLDHPLGLGAGDGVVDSNNHNNNNNKVSSNELSSPFVDEFLELSYCPDDWLVGTTIGE